MDGSFQITSSGKPVLACFKSLTKIFQKANPGPSDLKCSVQCNGQLRHDSKAPSLAHLDFFLLQQGIHTQFYFYYPKYPDFYQLLNHSALTKPLLYLFTVLIVLM